MNSERGNKNFAVPRCAIRKFLRLPISVLLLVMVYLFHSPVVGQETTFESLEQKALERIKEARGHARQERYSRAVSDLRAAVALAKQADRAKLTLALALHNMAEVYRLQGKSLDAVKAYRGALSIYTELDHQSAITITKTQISAMHPDAGMKNLRNADVAPSTLSRKTESRLSRIDQAVERIRRRLGPKEQPKPTRSAAQSSMAPGSIHLSRSSPRASRGAYAESVKRTVNRGWRYPPTAKSKHQEGSVEVELAILQDGELEDVRILQSSGFLTLDMESIRSVREAAPFGTHALPKGQQLTLRLLFDYQLPNPRPNKFKAQATRPAP